jgi:hypothetical protein
MVIPSSTLRWKLTGAMSILLVTTPLHNTLFSDFPDATVLSNISVGLKWRLVESIRKFSLLALISGLPIVNTIVMFWLKNIYVI